ncbi:MAG TPA: hypothetical protein VMI06_11915 [Terriglobia bacterium]|nr:hypothetical protein [Terriglobia bacterium]
MQKRTDAECAGLQSFSDIEAWKSVARNALIRRGDLKGVWIEGIGGTLPEPF